MRLPPVLLASFVTVAVAGVVPAFADGTKDDREAAATLWGCHRAFTAMSVKVAMSHATLAATPSASNRSASVRAREGLRVLIRGAFLTEAAASASGVRLPRVEGDAQRLAERVLANPDGPDAMLCQATYALLAAELDRSAKKPTAARFEALVDSTVDKALTAATTLRTSK